MAAKTALAVALAMPALTGAAALPRSKQIVGGEPASEGEFPFIVSLQQSGSHFCGGSLIDSTTVVTAAHCSDVSAGSVTVRGGSLSWSSGGVTSGVDSIVVHPDYDSTATNNDVAVWHLSEPLEGSGIDYVSLPSQGSDPSAGSDSTVAGWGYTSEGGGSLPDELRRVDVPIVSRADCNDAYGGDITDAMICAGIDEGGKDACQGDSGGPIVDGSGALIGVVSWGAGCARPGFAGVYTRIGEFVSWINSA